MFYSYKLYGFLRGSGVVSLERKKIKNDGLSDDRSINRSMCSPAARRFLMHCTPRGTLTCVALNFGAEAQQALFRGRAGQTSGGILTRPKTLVNL